MSTGLRGYFSEETISHLMPQQRISVRYLNRAVDVMLAAKLTLTYGKYHLMMLHREATLRNEHISYVKAEQTADVMNQMTIFHSSPKDFMHTPDESADESIDTFMEFKQLLTTYSDDYFVPGIVEQFCKSVYESDDHYIFFKPFCNLYYSVFADALLRYQQGEIDYEMFCYEFQMLSWWDGKRTPLNSNQLKRYIASMREIVNLYRSIHHPC